MASKKFFEQYNSNILWFSIIKILNTCENIFSIEQIDEIRTNSFDDLALIISNLKPLFCHIMGIFFYLIECIYVKNNGKTMYVMSKTWALTLFKVYICLCLCTCICICVYVHIELYIRVLFGMY
jgi:hypothetical protein